MGFGRKLTMRRAVHCPVPFQSLSDARGVRSEEHCRVFPSATVGGLGMGGRLTVAG